MLLIKYLLFYFTLHSQSVELNKSFILWNVGQGQWGTLVDKQSCLHFDMGGEKINEKIIFHYCSKKENYAFISHSDWDHISFLSHLKKLNGCIASPTDLKNKYLSKKYSEIKKCEQNHPQTELIHSPHKSSHSKKENSNDKSLVYIVDKRILVPGDSTKRKEKLWLKNINTKISILILGHHGSNTSSSQELLTKLKSLKFAIVSARYEKYHHPHFNVLARLKKNKTPVLKTEDWGHILVEL